MSGYYKFSNPKSEAEVLRDARAVLVQAVENMRAKGVACDRVHQLVREYDRLMERAEET